MLMDMSLSKFDICQGTRATNCFESHTSSWCPHFFKKKFCLMSGLQFTFVWRNIASTGRFVWAQKNYIQTWGNHMSLEKMNTCRWCLPLKNFRSRYRKLIWVGFESTTTEFFSDAKADWVIRPLYININTNIYIYLYIYI